MLKKILKVINYFPWYGYVFAACTILFQVTIYFITGQINGARAASIAAVDVKIPAIDNQIPFIPSSAIFYFASYPYWFFAALALTRGGKKELVNLAIGYSICIIIGLLFFVFMPTYLDREVEGVYEVAKSPGPMHNLLSFIYDNDGGKKGVNLFPSFHCLVTTYWCLAALFQKKMSHGWRTFTVIMLVLICTSTLTTKQHYFLDVIGGVGVAIIIFTIVKLVDPYQRIHNLKVKHQK